MDANAFTPTLSALNHVSIHAPVMDANRVTSLITRKRLSFNPRARDGRETLSIHSANALTCFNPRARDGRELFNNTHIEATNAVSIHAPVMDANYKRASIKVNASFQSTRP